MSIQVSSNSLWNVSATTWSGTAAIDGVIAVIDAGSSAVCACRTGRFIFLTTSALSHHINRKVKSFPSPVTWAHTAVLRASSVALPQLLCNTSINLTISDSQLQHYPQLKISNKTVIYTMNHKKRDILFLTIILANLNRFLWFLYHFNREEILHATVVKFTTSSVSYTHLTLPTILRV